MRAPWLGDVLEDAGLRVETPVGDPVGRGRDMDTIYGVVAHDTVTTTGWSDARVARLLRDGRSDLPGPLAQLGVRRDGTVDWIADGRCHHNGHGTWGNNSIGIECYAAGALAGREETWTQPQRDTVVVAARAILAHLDLGESSYWNPRLAGHKETDPDRKVDPHGVDMDELRELVAHPPASEEPMDATLLYVHPRDGSPDALAALWWVVGSRRDVAVTASRALAESELARGTTVLAVGGPAVRDLPDAEPVMGEHWDDTGDALADRLA